jgi:hypothetical protein
MARNAALSMTLLLAALASGCREQYFEGFQKIADHIFISNEHRTADTTLPDGSPATLINLKYINSLSEGETSEIFEIEFYCSTGAFRIMGGARYSEPGLEGTQTIVPQETESSIRDAPKGSAEDIVIAYGRSSEAICGKA